MSFNDVMLWIMAIGILLGALDKITGNHFGLGTKFDEGMKLMGPLALGMVGIVCLAPVLSDLLKPTLTPICAALHLDPAILGGILANDMGGYPLATELAILPDAGRYIGGIVASMLGCTLVFSIPVGLSFIEKEDQIFFSKGLLYGFITLPAGCLVGGILAGFSIPMVLINTIPIFLLSMLLAVGMKLCPNAMTKGCIIFGQILTIIITIGLACAAFTFVTGVTLIPNMAPISEAMDSVASIAIALTGAFPMLTILGVLLHRPLQYIGNKAGLDSVSILGFIIITANAVPVFGNMKNMKKRGIVLNTAWLVSASAALGDHLGFTAGVDPDLIGPLIAGKLTAASLAVLLAYWATREKKTKPENSTAKETKENSFQMKETMI